MQTKKTLNWGAITQLAFLNYRVRNTVLVSRTYLEYFLKREEKMGKIDNLLAATRKEPAVFIHIFFMYMITAKRKAGNWQHYPLHISDGQSAVNQDSERSPQATTWNSHFNIFLKRHRGELQNTTFRNNIPKNQNRLNFKDLEKTHTILSRHKVILKKLNEKVHLR